MQRLVVLISVLVLVAGSEPPTAPSPPPPRPPSPFANILGDYALTVELPSTCTQFPSALRVRRYDVTVQEPSYFVSGWAVGGGFREPVVVAEFHTQGFPPEPSVFRFKWNLFDVVCEYPEPLSESTDLYLCASGLVAVDGPTNVGNVLGGASVVRGDVTELACGGEVRFTFLRKE
jgi:hypothetical protein